MSGADENGWTKYAVDPMQPFPKRWMSPYGPIKVMTEPTGGYLMARRPGAEPFVITVAEILNAKKHPSGPFHPIIKGAPPVPAKPLPEGD